MNAKARVARRTIRTRRTENQARAAVATGLPQTARTHLIAAGLTPAEAKRFAGSFSRGTQPTATGESVIKLKGRRTKQVTIKLYDLAAFAARLAAYRPKDPAAADRFTRAAHRLAA